MNKKKYLYFTGLLLLIVLSLILSVLTLSRENIDNKNQGNKTISVIPQTLNWDIDGNKYVSTTDDPILLLNAINAYVNNIEIDGEIADIKNLEIKVYYTTEENESFSEEKSFSVYPNLNGGRIYLNIKRDVYDLRLDLFEGAERTAVINGIIVNPTDYIFSFTAFFSVLSLFILIIFVLTVIFLRKHFSANTKIFGKYKYLLFDLVSRDLKVKYRRSMLGFLWSVLNPLLMMLVITAVFSNIFKFDIKDFPVYYLTGTLIFNFVSESTSSAIGSIINSAGLIKKVYIPKYIFPLEKCIFAFVNMLFSLIAVAVVYLILRIELHWTIILFPVPMLYAFIFSVGLSLILSALNVFFRDIGHLYSVWVTAWMYLTPIIYPVSALPGAMLTVVKLNPLYYYVSYIRNVMIYGIVPDIQDNLICIGFSLIFLGLGLIIFKKKQDKFILYI